MSLFTLNEIKFQDNFDRDVGEDNFDINSYRYPLDIGTSKYNHFITFEIFVRDKINSDFGVAIEGGDPVEYQIRKELVKNRGQNISSLINGVSSSVDSSIASKVGSVTSDRSITSGTPSLSGTRGNSVPGNRGSTFDTMRRYVVQSDEGRGGGLSTDAGRGSMSRAAQNLKKDLERAFNTLKRAKESITLYMPDTLNFDYSHQYNNLSTSKNAAIAAAQLGGNLGTALISKGASNYSPFLAEVIDAKFKTEGLVSGALGYAVNPQFEVIYTSTNLREFQFDFMFYPRSEKEAEQVHKIINSFKFHAAPEIVSGSFGRYLLAPSAFDIGFYYNSSVNPNIPKISTCYLVSISSDYAPNGYSAYEVQGQNSPSLGGTGSPVAIRLQLRFMEGTMITKELMRGKVLSALTTGGASF